VKIKHTINLILGLFYASLYLRKTTEALLLVQIQAKNWLLSWTYHWKKIFVRVIASVKPNAS